MIELSDDINYLIFEQEQLLEVACIRAQEELELFLNSYGKSREMAVSERLELKVYVREGPVVRYYSEKVVR